MGQARMFRQRWPRPWLSAPRRRRIDLSGLVVAIGIVLLLIGVEALANLLWPLP